MKEEKDLTGQLEMTDNLTLGKRLKMLREERKLTQQAVADACAIPASSYANWEQDRSTPSIDRLIALAKCLNITTDVLLGVKREDEEIRLHSRLACLKPKQKQNILNLIDDILGD